MDFTPSSPSYKYTDSEDEEEEIQYKEEMAN